MSNIKARYDAFVEEVKSLGRQEGQGKDALTEMYLKVIDASSEGIVDLDKNKHGKGIDDASFLYGAYAAENRKNTRYSAGKEDANSKVQISKVRKVAEFGGMTKFGSHGNPVDQVNKLIKMVMLVREKSPRSLKELEGQYGITNSGSRKLRGLQEGILLLARNQLKADHVLSNAEIFELACKPVPHTKSVEEFLTAQGDRVASLREGTAESGTLHYDSPAMAAVATAIHSALEEIRALAAKAEEAEEINLEDVADANTPTDAEISAAQRKEEMALLYNEHVASDNGMPVVTQRQVEIIQPSRARRGGDDYKAKAAAMAAASAPDGSEEA